jgi:hypothetical protein
MLIRNDGTLGIPVEIVLMIFSYLEVKDLFPLFFVNKKIAEIAQKDEIWRERYSYSYIMRTR